MEQLTGRVAVVTGAGSGIGLAVTEAFAAEGMQVLMLDVEAERLRAEAERLAAAGLAVDSLVVDVTDPEAVEAAGAAAVERFGALHVAVNNAGIVKFGLMWEQSLEDWRAVIDVNLWGVVHGIRSFVPRILATGEEGHVVNTASMAALMPFANLAPYTVSKHGVLGLSDTLRDELRQVGAPVGVSVVFPGLIHTRINPGPGHDPGEVAANVVDAIRRNRSYVYTDHDFADEVPQRLQALIDSRSEVVG